MNAALPPKSLGKLLAGFAELPRDVVVSDLTQDGRVARPGCAFLAVRGTNEHGLRYAPQAVANGARAVLWEPAPSANVPDLPSDIVVAPVAHLREHVSEIAARFFGAPSTQLSIAGITGTNGKTTTTQLTAHMIGQAGKAVAAVGNIGTTVLDAIRDPNGFDVLVVELSSYQLHWMPREGPGAVMALASTCLNIAPDHFDWHGDARKHRDAKATVYWNTRVACVYNLDDEETRRMVEEAEVEEGCRAVGFGIGTPGPSDFGVVEDLLVDRAFLETRANNALEIAKIGRAHV